MSGKWHYFDEEDLAAVKKVLDQGVLGGLGDTPAIDALERAFCEAFGSPYAMACSSAMTGLHPAVAAAGAGCGDEVICDSLVGFGAVAAMFNNAIPVFADVQRDTFLMDPESLRSRISERTKAIIVTHLCGLMADMDEIMAIAKEHNLKVIEDCAHAIYATYNGKYAGTVGDFGVFSFQESKQMATGEGGLVTYRDPEMTEKLDEMIGFGTMPRRISLNYRMTQVIAAIAGVQFKRAKGYVDMGVAAGELYNAAVADSPLIAEQVTPAGRVHTYHLWGATYEGDKHGLPFEEFKRIGEENGWVGWWGYISKVPYLHDVIGKPLAFGRGCPTACPQRGRDAMYEEGTCPNAEEIMPRFLLVWTGGDPVVHEQAADALRKTVEAASG
jgi:perosamine synthetase